MYNARRLLRRDVQDESSARNSVSCHSLATRLCYAVNGVTLRGNITSVFSARNSISCHTLATL